MVFSQINKLVSVSETSTVNTHILHKTSKSIIAEVHPSSTMLPGKRPSITILVSKIWKFPQIQWSHLTYWMIDSFKTPDPPLIEQ